MVQSVLATASPPAHDDVVFRTSGTSRKRAPHSGSDGGTRFLKGSTGSDNQQDADRDAPPTAAIVSYRRRRHRSYRRVRSILTASAAVALAAAILSWHFREPDDPPPEQSHGLLTAASFRPEYPYSVVPGGVYSAEEFHKAIVRDSLVAAHYEDLRSFQLRPARLASSRAAYVSYRVNNAIYWTKRPVRLVVGERLLTDGEHVLRARCGNRISRVPRFPIRRYDPPPMVVDENEPGPDTPLIPARFEADIPLLPTALFTFGPVSPHRDSPETLRPTEDRVTGAPFTATPPITVIPEPESLVLLGSVLLLIGGVMLRRRPH